MARYILKSAYLFSAILIVACFFSLSKPVFATAGPGDINFETSPQNPGPFQDVTITLSSFAIDINRAQITWSVNGHVMVANTGNKTFSFKTGDIGVPVNIDISLSTLTDGLIKKNIVFIPSEVDLLWQAADSHVPPFYRGKSLPVKESKVKVVAMPRIKTQGGAYFNSNNLVYQWKQNFDVVDTASGYSKDSFTFTNNYLHPTDMISVVTSPTAAGAGSAEGGVAISYTNPFMLFYEKNPILGIQYNHAIESGFLLVGEETFIAEPYFFSPADTKSTDLTYTWKLNGADIATPENKTTITLKNAGTAGTAKISLAVKNIKTLFQQMQKTITINLAK